MSALGVVLIFSTRLSFLDEEGLPRGIGYAVAALLTGAFVIGSARLANVEWAVELAVGGTLFVAIGVALLNEESPVALAMGHVLFLFGGLGVIWGITLTFTYAVVGLRPAVFSLVLSLWLALFGAVGAGANVVGERRVTTALEQGWGALVVMVVAFVPLGLVVGGLLWLGPGVAGWLIAPAGSRPALVSLLLLLGLFGLGARFALGRLPLVSLAPRPERPRAIRARDVGRRVGRVVAVVGLVGGPVVVVLDLLGATDAFYATLPPLLVSAAATVLNASVLRLPIAALLVVAALLVLLATFLRGLTRDEPERGRRFALLFGVAAMILVPVSLVARLVFLAPGTEDALLVFFGVAVVAYLLVVAATGFFLTLLSLLPVAAGLGLVPDRGGGIATMAAGVFLATVSLGLGGAPPWAVYAGVAVALVVWDLSEFGLGLAEEVGRLPDVRRVELLHGVGSVAVAVVGVGLAAGLAWVTDAAGAAGPDALAASLVALLGTALLLAALRG